MEDRCSEIIHDKSRGLVICADDGRVIEERTVDFEFEPRGYTYEEMLERDRLGSPMPHGMENIYISTDFGTSYTSDGKRMDIDDRFRSRRLRKLHMRTMVEDRDKRYILRARKVIDQIASAFNLPKEVVNQALIIYSEAYRAGLLSGRPVECLAAAAIYIACRSMGIARSSREIENVISKEVKFYSCLRAIYEKIDLERLGVKPADMVKPLISRIISSLGLGGYVEEKAYKILGIAREKGATSGRSPPVIAAACVYLACTAAKIKVSTKEIAGAAGVSDTATKTVAREIMKILKQGAVNRK
ncbi:MAG: transcription initiation factor IIB family protein [Sulfolobales archaeon]